jgi:hypothetical protein
VWQVYKAKPTLFLDFLWDGCDMFSWKRETDQSRKIAYFRFLPESPRRFAQKSAPLKFNRFAEAKAPERSSRY